MVNHPLLWKEIIITGAAVLTIAVVYIRSRKK